MLNCVTLAKKSDSKVTKSRDSPQTVHRQSTYSPETVQRPSRDSPTNSNLSIFKRQSNIRTIKSVTIDQPTMQI